MSLGRRGEGADLHRAILPTRRQQISRVISPPAPSTPTGTAKSGKIKASFKVTSDNAGGKTAKKKIKVKKKKAKK